MDLKRKLSRLSKPAAPVAPEPPPEAPLAPSEAPASDPVIDALRAQIRALSAKGARARRRVEASEILDAADASWPFTADDTDDGALHRATTLHPREARHGFAPLSRALDARGAAVSTLALDASLAGFDPARALYVDTETTGLAGGTGTVPFLVGLGWFEGERFCVEQLLVRAPGEEAPVLARVAERAAWATSIVSFNGKSFDLPLLRTRLVMERRGALPALAHLDLLHVARRIYRARTADCTLGTLERDVLGFERVDDIPSAEIPERWLRFVREGDRAGLVAVARHNLWDVAALAALVGELSARVERLPAEGRLEATDLVGLAKTSLRAGDAGRALDLADDALGKGVVSATLARQAHLLAAEAHKKRRDPAARVQRLLDALALHPDDARLHLDLARSFERELNDATRALEHARKAAGAEDPSALTRRVRRLEARVRVGVQLRLPGVA
ncbi:MAG: ribonuclease H-like domain-containing protein [Polyangiales bacterium]